MGTAPLRLGSMSTPTFDPMVEPDRGGSTLVKEETDYRYDPGDNERFAHYAERDKIMEASVFGTPLTALCGKVWVPSRDPSRGLPAVQGDLRGAGTRRRRRRQRRRH